MKKQVLIYGSLLGVLIVVLDLIKYKFLILDNAMEVYGGLVALIFTVVGIWLGLKLTRKKEVVLVKEVRINTGDPFVLDEKKLAELEITQREHEILDLIAKGMSNQEIADKLFVSLNTIKTHSSRLFEKLNVNRRTQAVQKGKELGLIP